MNKNAGSVREAAAVLSSSAGAGAGVAAAVSAFAQTGSDVDEGLLASGALLRTCGLLAAACVAAGPGAPAALPCDTAAALLPGLLVALHAALLPAEDAASSTAAHLPRASVSSSTAAVTWLGQVFPALLRAADSDGLHASRLEAFARALLAWGPPAHRVLGLLTATGSESAAAAFPQPLAALIALVEQLHPAADDAPDAASGPRAAAAALLAAACLHPDVAAATAQGSDLL